MIKNKNNKMKIGVDLDDVIVPFSRNFLNFYNQETNSNFEYEDWRLFHFSESFNIPKTKVLPIISKFYFDGSLEGLGIVEGAKESIYELAKEHLLYFITSRPRLIKRKTKEILKKELPGLEFKIIHTNERSLFNLLKLIRKDKADICSENDIKLLIEDNLEYALNCASKGIMVLLFDKPWNRNLGHENITRVYNWNEILEKINGIKQENAKLFSRVN